MEIAVHIVLTMDIGMFGLNAPSNPANTDNVTGITSTQLEPLNSCTCDSIKKTTYPTGMEIRRDASIPLIHRINPLASLTAIFSCSKLLSLSFIYCVALTPSVADNL